MICAFSVLTAIFAPLVSPTAMVGCIISSKTYLFAACNNYIKNITIFSNIFLHVDCLTEL
jgi:hypothetical protein